MNDVADPRLWRSLPIGRRTVVMGVINMTPDSVSGDGLGTDIGRAVAQGRRLVEAGAAVLDVGGESTRPGATPVDHEEELRRVAPTIGALAAELPVPISVDTTKAVVARAALAAGAS